MPKKEPVVVTTAKIAMWSAIVVAVIGLLGILIPLLIQNRPESENEKTEYVGRVLDMDTQQPISGAQITLELAGVPPIVYTDSVGVYRFDVEINSEISGQIRVDAQGYDVYTRNITLSPDENTIEDIRLTLP